MERVSVDGDAVDGNTLHGFVVRTAASYSVLLTGADAAGVFSGFVSVGLVEAALCDGAELGLPDAMVAGWLWPWW